MLASRKLVDTEKTHVQLHHLPECGPGKDFDFMSHHTHFVEGGLPVKDNKISILKMPFYGIPDLKVQVTRLLVVPEITLILIS